MKKSEEGGMPLEIGALKQVACKVNSKKPPTCLPSSSSVSLGMHFLSVSQSPNGICCLLSFGKREAGREAGGG